MTRGQEDGRERPREAPRPALPNGTPIDAHPAHMPVVDAWSSPFGSPRLGARRFDTRAPGRYNR